ncbi:hypothetical protein Tco_0893347, partial [Tanacetum coccineum]
RSLMFLREQAALSASEITADSVNEFLTDVEEDTKVEEVLDYSKGTQHTWEKILTNVMDMSSSKVVKSYPYQLVSMGVKSKRSVVKFDIIVGICGMGEICITHLIRPTRELLKIIVLLYDARLGGSLLLLEAVADAHDVWFSCSDKEVGIHLLD